MYFLLLKIANAFVLDTLSKNLELRHKLQRIVISSQNLRYYFDYQYFNHSIYDLNLFIIRKLNSKYLDKYQKKKKTVYINRIICNQWEGF